MSINKLEKHLTVKLVAIAKDEAAYLPEWIHHHLYMGFDAIDIYVNRTSDNSESVLFNIHKNFPQVSYFSADWIDDIDSNQNNNLQFIIYAKAFFDNQTNGQFDYIMFLDVDEYWTPNNLELSISESILMTPDADSVSFGWLNMHGVEKSFSLFSSSISGQLNPLVKTAIKADAKIIDFGLHRPLLKDGTAKIGGDGTFIASKDNSECLHADLQCLRPVMIVHRMFRSPMEYVSLLSRGRPSDNYPLKLNRKGYNLASGEHVTWYLEPEALRLYHKSYREFVEQNGLNLLLIQAQNFVKQRYQATINAIKLMPIDTYPQLFMIFQGVSENVYKCFLKELEKSSKMNSCIDKLQLFNLARKIEKIDRTFAQRLMAKAVS